MCRCPPSQCDAYADTDIAFDTFAMMSQISDAWSFCYEGIFLDAL